MKNLDTGHKKKKKQIFSHLTTPTQQIRVCWLCRFGKKVSKCVLVGVCVALEGVFNVSEEAFCRGVPALMNEGRDPNMTSIFSHAPHYSASNELRILSPTLAELHTLTHIHTISYGTPT